MTIYDRIRQLRISAGMSQDDLAHAMGYKDRSMITKIESGKVDISQKKIISFARVLNTTPGYLMGWTDEKTVLPKNNNDRMTELQNSLGLLMDDEAHLIISYRSLSPRGKDLLNDRAEELKLLYGKKSEDSSAESV